MPFTCFLIVFLSLFQFSFVALERVKFIHTEHAQPMIKLSRTQKILRAIGKCGRAKCREASNKRIARIALAVCLLTARHFHSCLFSFVTNFARVIVFICIVFQWVSSSILSFSIGGDQLEPGHLPRIANAAVFFFNFRCAI